MPVAGCMGGGGPGLDANGTGDDGSDGAPANGTGDTTGDGSDGATDPGSGGEEGTAAIAVADVEAPESAEIGSPYEIALRLRNTGDGGGSMRVRLYARNGSAWTPVLDREVTVAAGANRTVRASGLTGRALGRGRYRVGEDGREIEVRHTGAGLQFGESFRVGGHTEVTVDEIEYRRQYVWLDGEEERRVKAPTDRKYAWVTLSARNVGDRRRRLPDPGEFRLTLDGEEYEPFDPERQQERYEGGEVLPGTEREGWVAFEVPSDIDEGAVGITWGGSTEAGDLLVSWRREG